MRQICHFKVEISRTAALRWDTALPVLTALHGRRHDVFAFELVAMRDGVAVYLSCSTAAAAHLVAQFHAHHADVTLRACADPLDPHALRCAGDAVLQSPELFRLQTDHGDGEPLAGLIAALDRAARDGSTWCAQITFAPVAPRAALRRLNYLAVVCDRWTGSLRTALASHGRWKVRARLRPVL
jgi:hypothetical protein